MLKIQFFSQLEEKINQLFKNLILSQPKLYKKSEEINISSVSTRISTYSTFSMNRIFSIIYSTFRFISF